MKNVTVIIDRSPTASNDASEKLRMAVGLLLEDENAVTVMFSGDGLRALDAGIDPALAGLKPVQRHAETLGAMGAKLYAVAEGGQKLGYGAEQIGADRAAEIIAGSHSVI